jgi:predicted amidohydrolase
VGVAICSDGAYFEMVRLLAFRGAEIIFAPHAARLRPFGNNRESFVRWRLRQWPVFARDNCVYIAACNSAGLYEKRTAGDTPTVRCSGALVMDYNGEVLARLTGKTRREALLTTDLDLDALRQAREAHELYRQFNADIVYNRKSGWVFGRTEADRA